MRPRLSRGPQRRRAPKDFPKTAAAPRAQGQRETAKRWAAHGTPKAVRRTAALLRVKGWRWAAKHEAVKGRAAHAALRSILPIP